MFALHHASLTHIQIGDIAAAQANAEELSLLASDKDASLWRAFAILTRGCLLALNGDNLGRHPDDHTRDSRIAINGSSKLCAVVFATFGDSLFPTEPI